MELIDNKQKILSEDLKNIIERKSNISIAAPNFSMYAFASLQKSLEAINTMKFLFTSPAFISDTFKKEKREFYIPKLSRERNLYGTEFEIKLKNELTQKAIAKECAEWIKEKVQFKTNTTEGHIDSMISVATKRSNTLYTQIKGFTTTGLGLERGNSITNFVQKFTEKEIIDIYQNNFNELWHHSDKLKDITNEIIEKISAVYKENPPELIYSQILNNIFSEFLEEIDMDSLPNESTGFKQSIIWNKLYDFQKDAVTAAINKLEQYNGCILADSVGLGKTFSALGVIKYYELRNKSVLVLCPKKLAENWMTYRENLRNNILQGDRLNYRVLYHTDLSRKTGMSNGIPLDKLNWGNFDLLVIDESHNFRNNVARKETETRYKRLMNKVIKDGVKTKVLMLSATPVNNRFADLKNQLALAYEGNSQTLEENLNTERTVDEIFKRAQVAFNE